MKGSDGRSADLGGDRPIVLSQTETTNMNAVYYTKPLFLQVIAKGGRSTRADHDSARRLDVRCRCRGLVLRFTCSTTESACPPFCHLQCPPDTGFAVRYRG